MSSEYIVLGIYPLAKCLKASRNIYDDYIYIILKDKTQGWFQYLDWTGFLSSKKYSEQDAWDDDILNIFYDNYKKTYL